MASHVAIYLESMGSALDSQWNHTDRFAAMMPMFHTAQLNAFCTPAVLVGATIYVLRGFDPAALLNLIESERISQVFGLPMMYRALLDHPSFPDRELASLRRCVYAMAPMPDALIRRCLDGFGCDFALLFGQTEMSPVTTLFRPEHQLSHIGAVGTPITGVQVAIMGPGGELLPQGEQGEIVYRGPSTMTEYLHNASATDAAFAHGWFHSGDVGWFGPDGVLWFADRYKDVIKTGGENVASIEVEKAVYAADPRVAEAVVVGLPHERWSEAITAVVVPKPGSAVRPRGAAGRAAWPAGRLQGAQGGDRGGRAAQDVHRQDPEERAPGPARGVLRGLRDYFFGRYLSRRRACSLLPLCSLSAAILLACCRSASVSRLLRSRNSASSRWCPDSFQIRPWSSFL